MTGEDKRNSGLLKSSEARRNRRKLLFSELFGEDNGDCANAYDTSKATQNDDRKYVLSKTSSSRHGPSSDKRPSMLGDARVDFGKMSRSNGSNIGAPGENLLISHDLQRKRKLETSSSSSGPETGKKRKCDESPTDKHLVHKILLDAVKFEKTSKTMLRESSSNSKYHRSTDESQRVSEKSEKSKTPRIVDYNNNGNGEAENRCPNEEISSGVRGRKHCDETAKERADKKEQNGVINVDGGIDSKSGASFAEALSMCMDRPRVQKRTPPVSPTPTILETIKTGSETSPHLAPNIELEPLNFHGVPAVQDIGGIHEPPTLPPHLNATHRKQEEARTLSEVLSTKNQRTKVYSGNKAGCMDVPSLKDLCLRKVMKNAHALRYTGGIPYEILEPVLKGMTADQLLKLENYNPYLTEHTDLLWKNHCSREFRGCQPEEMDSWRETYMRCRDEREARLRKINAVIKASIAKSRPVRSAKLVFLDNMVKPPPKILRRQAKNGSAKSSKTRSHPKMKLALTVPGNSATRTATPPPSGHTEIHSSSRIVEKKTAPSKAKVLRSVYRSLFRR